MSLHPLLTKAAEGAMPEWAVASPKRREHAGRVAELLGEWARARGHDDEGVARWRAAGTLHDALRDADPTILRGQVSPDLVDLPPRALHGPAAAERLRVDGVLDGSFLRAVAYHTVGHPHLDDLGRALYAADFLEPGRAFLTDWRAGLRARMPSESDAVVKEILSARIGHLVEVGRPVRGETMDFWNSMAREG